MGADDTEGVSKYVVKTPCQLDHEATGREWADDVPPKSRTEIQAMASLCSGCPIIRECAQRAEQIERDYGPGTVGGVWGGEWWRDGQTLDPWGPEHGDMRSVYLYVWYDKDRDSWRAEKVHEGKRIYIMTSKDEDKVGQAAYNWRLKNEDI